MLGTKGVTGGSGGGSGEDLSKSPKLIGPGRLPPGPFSWRLHWFGRVTPVAVNS